MTRRKITPGPIGTDVNLEVDDLRLPDASRLTDNTVAGIAERALARHRGRPSFSGGREHTSSLTVRVSAITRTALEEIAAAQGRRVAGVSRDAFEEYIRRHAS